MQTVLLLGDTMFQEYLWVWFQGYLLGNFSSYDITRIQKAFEFSRRAHSGKLRLDKTPYFNHVVRAAIIPCMLGIFNADLTIVILLHDVREENNKVSFAKLSETFGVLNANRVQMLTKYKRKTVTYYFLSLLKCDDWIVLLAKLCDRLDNQRTLGAGEPIWQLKKNIETVEYFPRLLTRCENQIHLAIEKGILPRKSYYVLMRRMRVLYHSTMQKPYKKHFVLQQK